MPSDSYPREPKDQERAEDVAMQGRFLMKPREWAAWAIRFVTDWRPPILARGEPPKKKPPEPWRERDDS